MQPAIVLCPLPIGPECGSGSSGHRRFVVCVQSHKKDSPSSGLFRVKVYNEHGMAQRNGTGLLPRLGACAPWVDQQVYLNPYQKVDAAESRLGPGHVPGGDASRPTTYPTEAGFLPPLRVLPGRLPVFTMTQPGEFPPRCMHHRPNSMLDKSVTSARIGVGLSRWVACSIAPASESRSFG